MYDVYIYVYIYMNTYSCISIYTYYIYIYVYTFFVYMNMCVCMGGASIHRHIYIYVYTYVHMSTRNICAFTRTYTHSYAYVYVYMYICMHTYIYIYIHKYLELLYQEARQCFWQYAVYIGTLGQLPYCANHYQHHLKAQLSYLINTMALLVSGLWDHMPYYWRDHITGDFQHGPYTASCHPSSAAWSGRPARKRCCRRSRGRRATGSRPVRARSYSPKARTLRVQVPNVKGPWSPTKNYTRVWYLGPKPSNLGSFKPVSSYSLATAYLDHSSVM